MTFLRAVWLILGVIWDLLTLPDDDEDLDS